MDGTTALVVGGALLTLILSLLIRRDTDPRDADPVDRAASGLDSAAAKAELYANADRARNAPPPL